MRHLTKSLERVSVMEQTALSLLQKVVIKLDNIETQVYKQNDRINSLEKSVKLIHAQNKLEPQDNETKTKFSSGGNDNFINHVKTELRNAAAGTTGEGKSRSKIKKTSSFNESSSRVKPVRVRRSPHTVPSDKDEERRLNSFRRECLSKSIQWNLVDLVNAMPEKHFVLPKWLSREEAKFVMEGTERKNLFRRFLCILRKRDFETMQGWLHNCGFHAKALRQVWETFEEFSDKEINRSRLKCFQCRLIENVSVVNVADYLYSADILTSDQEYLRVASSERPVGAQDELWRYVLQECKKYICSDMVAIALKVALTDCMNLADEKVMYESLLTDINVSDTQELLACSCSVRCSQSLHPPSCLKTMSLAGVYFSPPTQRKRESSSSEGPLSSFSSGSSVETVCNSTIEEKIDRNKDTLSLDDETHLKQPIAITDDNRKSDVNRNVATFSHRTESVRSRSARRRMSQRKVENVPSDSSLENLERENEKVRNSYKSLTCKLENKPNVMPVHANKVYINTGPKYIQLGKGRTSESSSEH